MELCDCHSRLLPEAESTTSPPINSLEPTPWGPGGRGARCVEELAGPFCGRQGGSAPCSVSEALDIP